MTQPNTTREALIVEALDEAAKLIRQVEALAPALDESRQALADAQSALTVQLAAGLDGVERKLQAREPVNRNIFTMSYRDRRKYRIDELPRDLHEALEMFEKDAVVKAALGEHLTQRFLEAKRNEVLEYNRQVSRWEIESYLGRY